MHAPVYKVDGRETPRKKLFWFEERGSSLHLVVTSSPSLSPGSGCTHPSQWRHRSSSPTPTRADSRESARTNARYDYVTRSVQQPLEPESSSYSFFFRVLQFLKFIREFRDETRLFSNEPLLPRFPIRKLIPLPGRRRNLNPSDLKVAWNERSWVKMDLSINRIEGLELIRLISRGSFLFGFILSLRKIR